MDAGLIPNTTSETAALTHKTCDSHIHYNGPSLGHPRNISARDKCIVGIILGGTAILAAVCLLIIRWRKQRAKIRDARRKAKGKGKGVEKGAGVAPPGSVPPKGGGEGAGEVRVLPGRSISWGDC
ncbi:hypothetical protein F5Y12DRAFT_716027 [Xylaria sp. FL1777]|nr:hypothetical protein F5Y12DRAFT_716027 [Xylaria sp. FL1777]